MTISRTIRVLLKLQLLLSLMACFVAHLIVANSGYILWLVSQVSMFNILVSTVGVVCFIMVVSVFINYFRFIFSEFLACV